MTDFIFITVPWLLIAPLSAFLFSAVCAVTKSKLLAAVSIIVHSAAIAALIYFDGGLTDIFATLLLSVLSSSLFGTSRAARFCSTDSTENAEVTGK